MLSEIDRPVYSLNLTYCSFVCSLWGPGGKDSQKYINLIYFMHVSLQYDTYAGNITKVLIVE